MIENREKYQQILSDYPSLDNISVNAIWQIYNECIPYIYKEEVPFEELPLEIIPVLTELRLRSIEKRTYEKKEKKDKNQGFDKLFI